jgi:hypothetical protein
MRFAWARRDASEAFGTAPPPHASEAFGQKPARGPRSSEERARLAVLLACLGLSLIALVRSNNVFVSQAPVAASPPSWCLPRQPPKLARITAGQLLDLRAIMESVMRHTGGRGYVWGTVPPTVAWTDNAPESDSLNGLAGGRWPGSFEIRQWAPDPQWGASYRDDVGGDVFLFAESAQATRFFSEATSIRCHRSGSERLAELPSQARYLTWVNPDGATQEDVFVLRGRLVYRISDVRPQNDRQPPSSAEQEVGVATVEALACTLPGAKCSRRRSDRRVFITTGHRVTSNPRGVQT